MVALTCTCPPGGMILAADYSQLELRVLAHLSKDQRLLQVCVSSRNSSVKTFFANADVSPGAKRGGRCVPMHRRRVEKRRPRFRDRRSEATGETGTTGGESGPRRGPHGPADACPSLQICYGIIYGMGAKSLGEQMGVEENEAARYIETFKSRYRGDTAPAGSFYPPLHTPVLPFQGSAPS